MAERHLYPVSNHNRLSSVWNSRTAGRQFRLLSPQAAESGIFLTCRRQFRRGGFQNSFPKQRTKEQNLHLHLFPLFCKKSPACPSFPRDRQNGSREYQSACWPESRKFLTSESRQLRRGTNQNHQPFMLFNRFPSFAIAYMAAPEG